MHFQIAIVGAGAYGLTVAEKLRIYGFDGTIGLFGAEDNLPYNRPVLSKKFLTETVTDSEIELRNSAYFSQLSIELVLGKTVTDISIDNDKRLFTSDGRSYTFEKLVLATGLRPKKLGLPGESLPGVHVLRNLDDARKLKINLEAEKSMAIIGAGFIGLEVASAAIALGLEVTLVDRNPGVLSKRTSLSVSGYLLEQQLSKGLQFIANEKIVKIHQNESAKLELQLSSGKVIERDLVLMALGSEANSMLGQKLNLEMIGDRIVVNNECRASETDVWAGGDLVFRFPSAKAEEGLVIESIQNALEHGDVTAKSILGMPKEADRVPWFWSDQGSNKLQICGLVQDHLEKIEFTTDKGLVVTHFKQGYLVAIECVNEPATFLLAKKALEVGKMLEMESFAQSEVDLKGIFRS